MTFIRRKVAAAVLLLAGLSLVSFGVLRFLPGDPAEVIAGNFADQATIDTVRQEMKLDRPFLVQYVDYVSGAVRGDLGQSYINRRPVRSLIARPLATSVKLMLLAQLLALGISVPLGLWLGYRKGSRLDRAVNGIAFALISVPGFVSGIVLALLLGYRLHLFPTVYPTDADTLPRQLRALFLPALAIALTQTPVYMRLLRSDTIATLKEDFITSARARGLRPSRVLVTHALRPSSFSLLTLAGVNIGHLIGGAVVVERVFAIPGLGTTLINAVSQRDYLVAVGIILTVGAGFVAINLVVDILYGIIDPRVRVRR